MIQVANGGVMLLKKAKTLVELGRARIINERVHMLNPTDVGYERAPGYTSFGGQISFDPDLGGGPTVQQFSRKRAFRDRS